MGFELNRLKNHKGGYSFGTVIWNRFHFPSSIRSWHTFSPKLRPKCWRSLTRAPGMSFSFNIKIMKRSTRKSTSESQIYHLSKVCWLKSEPHVAIGIRLLFLPRVLTETPARVWHRSAKYHFEGFELRRFLSWKKWWTLQLISVDFITFVLLISING